MIPFFRKIRKQFADDNKPVKYMRYAIGEIVLVVIGILIALQINNWNEGRKQQNLMNSYVSRLISDIQKDTIDIRSNREWLNEAQNIIENTIQLLNKKAIDTTSIPLIENYFTRGWHTYIPIFNDNTYKDLSQTGNMNLLKNTEIRKKIMLYYSRVEDARNSFKINNEWVLPTDVKVTEITSAMEFSPKTKALFEGKDKQLAIKNILFNKDILERSAAAHYWMNIAVLEDLVVIENEARKLLLSLNNLLNTE